ncbi:PAS domain S-box protein [Mangrovactinospora gilvigrisea]|uniref:PAS domain S-box protein n=1 Tax=Mangrovactinospora gilvigrisea TaxID=1428644 RepID=A0A1J7BDX0_9ACTN|nr:SpoIIE family protein phosphatase [Mangrovactinospora gilvigrisea]OIV36867.1 PAS domain S-box protein [Mangrovactinospora gilvigrisea]
MITARASATFGPVGRSVAAARAFVRDTLAGWGVEELTDDAVVLTSELVTNAVVHAGTTAEVLCLRTAGERDGVRIEVADLYPKRRLQMPGHPDSGGAAPMDDPEREGGRGLLLCSTLSSRWGVEYSPDRKHVWFLLQLPERPAGTRAAGPALPDERLPAAPEEVKVAVVQVDADGTVTGWNPDADQMFGHPAKDVAGRPFSELVAWPQSPGISLGLDEALKLSRWEGTYGVRDITGRIIRVYGSHLRVRDTTGRPFTVALLVREAERAVLSGGARPRPSTGAHPGTPAKSGAAAHPLDVGDLLDGAPPEDLDGLLQRTVERARDALDGDASFLLLATDDETELEVRATTGLTGSRQRFARVPVETGTLRYGNTRMPAVHDDLAEAPGAVPMLTGSGMRSLVTVPLKVEGRLTGSLGVAAESAHRYTNEDALRLQFAADRVALAVESARLTELERLRRDSLSFLVEASDLLAGTLERDQTLALMAQMTVPTLASWCAVYTTDEHAQQAALEYVLHEDEDRIDGLRALLERVGPPTPDPVPGPRIWMAPAQEARRVTARYGADSPVSALTADAVTGETVVLPLLARNRVIGLLALGRAADERIRQEVLELADELSRRAALALDNSRLYSERTAISQALQRSLLPPELPRVPGVEVEVIYRAAGQGNEVGGDFYDLFEISPGKWGMAIGDVCGTGPEAAAVTGLARHALRLLAREGLTGPQVLERLNAAILDEGSRSRFLTLLYGELELLPSGHAELKTVCAGHPLPLLLGVDGRVASAAHPQPLLGVMDDLELHEEMVVLSPGDVLLCVTDGVTERREGTRMLGDDGLERVLAGCVGLTAGGVAARVERAVERFAAEPPSDDMAILVLRMEDARG